MEPIMKQMEQITSTICENYCKFSQQCAEEYPDESDFMDHISAICAECPLSQFLV